MNASTLEKLEQLILKPSNLQNQISSNPHADILDKSFATKKRLLLKKGRTFGFTIRRWYTIVGFELLLYQSKQSIKPKKIKSLHGAKVKSDGKVINKEKHLGLNLLLADHSSVWLAVDNETEKQQLLMLLNPGIDNPPAPKSRLQESKSVATLGLEVSESKDVSVTSNGIITIFDDADVFEDLNEETSFAKTVTSYSLSMTKLKTEVDTQSRLNSARKILQYRDPSYSIQTLAENNEKGMSLLERLCAENGIITCKRSDPPSYPDELLKSYSNGNQTFARVPPLKWKGPGSKGVDMILDGLIDSNSGSDIQRSVPTANGSLAHMPNKGSPHKRMKSKVSHVRSLSEVERAKHSFPDAEFVGSEQRKSIEQFFEGSLKLDKENAGCDFMRFSLMMCNDSKTANAFNKANDDIFTLNATLNTFGPRVTGNSKYFDQFKDIGAEDALLSQTLTLIPDAKDLTEDYKILSSLDAKKGDFPSEGPKKLTIGLPPERRFGLRKSLLTKLVHLIDTRCQESQNYDSSKLAGMSADEALNLMYQFRIKEAREVYKHLSTTDFRHRLSVIECDLLLLGLNGSRKEITDVLTHVSEFQALLNQNQAPQKKNLNNFVNHEVMRAESNLIKAFVNGILGNKLQFLLCVSESWSIFKKLDILLENKKVNDTVDSSNRNRVLFGTGLFNLVFSLIPSNLLKVMRIIGFTPNRALGIKKLEKCWKNNTIRSPHAAVLLCVYHLEFGSEVLHACKIVESALTQYPHIPYFLWLGAVLSWKFCQVNFIHCSMA